jgi:hypothetical protein
MALNRHFDLYANRLIREYIRYVLLTKTLSKLEINPVYINQELVGFSVQNKYLRNNYEQNHIQGETIITSTFKFFILYYT